jgi:ABC-2 type transport system permease protein
MYGGIMAAVGAISPNTREANQTIWLIVLPQLPAIMFASEFAENPNGPLAVFLSIFPLSAPGAMVTRLAVTEVPAWQLALSLGLLVATAYAVIALAARFFQAGNLLSSSSFSYKRLFAGWKN